MRYLTIHFGKLGLEGPVFNITDDCVVVEVAKVGEVGPVAPVPLLEPGCRVSCVVHCLVCDWDWENVMIADNKRLRKLLLVN